MTALTKEKDTSTIHYDFAPSLLAKGSLKIWNGSLVAVGTDGYARPAADAADLKVIGRANESVDTLTTVLADGALSVETLIGVFTYANPAGANQLTVADVGKFAYVVDDQTVARATGTANQISAGRVVAVDTTNNTATICTRSAQINQLFGPSLRNAVDLIAASAAQGVSPYVPAEFTFDMPDAATANYDFLMPRKFEVTDVTVIKNGAGAGNTVQVLNTANPISDAIVAAVDKVVTRAGTLDRAFNQIAAAGLLRLAITRAAGLGGAKIFVKGFFRA